MSETQTLGPCTECGTPRDACTAPDYCCDECLHFPPDWDGYEPPQAAEPTGDVREQILGAAELEGLFDHANDTQRLRESFGAHVLALPAVRDALAAQETVRRYADDPALTSEQLRDLVARNRELEATVRAVLAVHWRIHADEPGCDDYCAADGFDWPCATYVAVADAVEGEQA